MALGWKNQYSKYKDFFLNAYDSYKKKEEARMFLEILLSLSVAAFFTFLALRPTVLTILDLLKTIEEKERIVAVMDEKISNLETARQMYDRNIQTAQMAEVAVPEVPSPDTFSRQVLGLGQGGTVVLGGIAIEKVILSGEIVDQTSGDLESLPEKAHPMDFSLNISSPSFSSMNNFLSGLKSLRIPISLDTYTISSQQEDEIFNLILAVTGRSPYLGSSE